MNKKCLGCGILLQTNDETKQGYTSSLENNFCMRCFSFKNYGKYDFIKPTDHTDLIKSLDKDKALFLFVIDLLDIPSNLKEISSMIKNNKLILVLNKKDLLPSFVKEEKIKSYFKSYSNIIVSSKNNYNFDTLYDLIKTNKKVYLIGKSNAGKSSIINKLMKLYTDKESDITVSYLTQTTLDLIPTKINDTIVIDTPGLIDDGNILNYLPKEILKKALPSKVINPRSYKTAKDNAFLIDNIFRISSNCDNTFIFFISNSLTITRTYSENNERLIDLDKKTLKVKKNSDLVIPGLGFIKIVKDSNITIYLPKEVKEVIRPSFI